jgi:hypothetical protein
MRLIPAGLSLAQAHDHEERQGMGLLCWLPTLKTNHSIAIIELYPESEEFGEILSEVEQPEMEHPLHHLFYSPNGRLYASGLDPSCSLAEVRWSPDAGGAPVISGFDSLDTQGQIVSEDIIMATLAY